MLEKMSDLSLNTKYDKVLKQYSNNYGISTGFNSKTTKEVTSEFKPVKDLLKVKKR